jgi:hypothetical protein
MKSCGNPGFGEAAAAKSPEKKLREIPLVQSL